mmetsp:Transcript_22488/g.45064  ORF Transcript_22488/g.45064 Transcript_22488/m.45064 type:complete len:225 (-) Transcript_22488:2-676(-)
MQNCRLVQMRQRNHVIVHPLRLLRLRQRRVGQLDALVLHAIAVSAGIGSKAGAREDRAIVRFFQLNFRVGPVDDFGEDPRVVAAFFEGPNFGAGFHFSKLFIACLVGGRVCSTMAFGPRRRCIEIRAINCIFLNVVEPRFSTFTMSRRFKPAKAEPEPMVSPSSSVYNAAETAVDSKSRRDESPSSRQGRFPRSAYDIESHYSLYRRRRLNNDVYGRICYQYQR